MELEIYGKDGMSKGFAPKRWVPARLPVESLIRVDRIGVGANMAFRRSLFERAGKFRPGFEGGQDYDLLLRATELTDRIHHVPRVLYHWRSLPTSTASVAAVKPVMFTSCERGLRERLSRWGINAEPYSPAFAERLRLPISLLEFPDDGPSVAIVVPVRAGAPIPKLRQGSYGWHLCGGWWRAASRAYSSRSPTPFPACGRRSVGMGSASSCIRSCERPLPQTAGSDRKPLPQTAAANRCRKPLPRFAAALCGSQSPSLECGSLPTRRLR